MNFKRNYFRIISLALGVFALTSCVTKNTFKAYKNIDEVVDTHEDIIYDDGSYIKPGDYASYSAKNSHDDLETYSDFYDVFAKRSDKKLIRSTGDRKILVVPVNFVGYTCQNLNIKESEYIDNLNKAFFGYSKNNRYVSVAEYYNRSSYGKLRISGKVCDKFYTFSTAFSLLDTYPAKYTRDTVYYEYQKVLDWYANTYGDSLDEYRINPEDPTSPVAMYLVYTFPTELATGNPDFFWAYTFERAPLSWSSYSALNTVTGKPDAHTYIHETGHLFGLLDYYPKEIEKDKKSNIIDPAGRIDMMDCSVGDHSCLSKMMLNWARPYVVKDSCEIKIKSLINSGDIILINDIWNGSVFDEYYLIELYSPLGLNHLDSISGNTEAVLPSLPGIKIHHVDARLAYFYNKVSESELIFSHYCDEEYTGTDPLGFGTIINFAHNNSTYSESKTDPVLHNNFYELQLNGVGHPVSGCAGNSDLFRKGDSFIIENFNDITPVNTTKYEVKVSSLSYYEATLEITKLSSN